VPPLALLVGCIGRGRDFVRQYKWELGLFLLTLLLAMFPSIGLFRWSFRWLPLVHLALALLAAGSIQLLCLHRNTQWFLFLCLFGSLLLTYWRMGTTTGVPRYAFAPSLTTARPLDPARLYLSVYPSPEFSYRIESHPQAVGEVTRPGSTSMWAGLRFLNGYSPIGGARVSREFALKTHGEAEPTTARRLIEAEAGPNDLLALLGVDGIVLAREMGIPSPPEDEWALLLDSTEDQVFHRRGAPLPIIRSVESVKDLPNEKWTKAEVSLIEAERNEISAEIAVPPAAQPACLLVSRPFFPGYIARLGSMRLEVMAYRGLIPMIKVPPGANGRLTISYRPAWLVWGGAMAIACALGWLVGIGCAARAR
jgi:hypothetical protein